ncbi:MAG: MFS transporter, partial [Armatimonadetes bacterium]|nr:MFS transporter [Armatimonadota bacterium]
IRGKIFGKRNRLLGLVTLISTFLAGGILHLFNNKNIFYGFALIFFIAFIFRMTSSFLLNSMYESKLIIKKELSFSFKEFLRRLPFNNFGKFVIFVSLMSLATYSSAPFYSMYMLRDLKLSYFHYTFLITIAAFINLLFMPYWGEKADRYGNIKILKISGFLVPFAAIVWFFSANFNYLIFCMFFSGLAWSGFNLSFNNFIYDSTSPARRARCIAYFNVLNGAGIFLGSMLGSLLARQKIFIFFGSNLPFIFLISGILRLLVSLFLLRGLREIRTLKEVKIKDFILDIIGIYPITSFIKKRSQTHCCPK